MKIASDIIHKHSVKSLVPCIKAPVSLIKKQISYKDSEALNFTSDLVNLIKKILTMLKKRPFLNSNLEPKKFFGLENYEKMSREKTEALFTYFKNFEYGSKFFNVESSQSCSISDNKSLANLFKNLKSDFGCTKITFNDKCFKGVFHTLGFVRDKGVLYVLDSLGHNKKVDLNVLNFHNKLKNVLTAYKKDSKLEKIIFNTKTQQSVDELTCNHWTYANIEALIRVLRTGQRVENNKALDSVLPTDINKILNEHKNFVLNRHLIYTSK